MCAAASVLFFLCTALEGLGAARAPDREGLRLGIERPAEIAAALRGRKVGLICNHSSVDRRGRHLADLLVAQEGIEVVALFGPEHGIRGNRVGAIEDGRDARTGLVVHSLYGKTRQPSAEMLAGIDTLVFDIQDVGARFYTYISTMSLAMEAAATRGLRFVVLDRPNPLGGEIIEGPTLDPGQRSFVGCQPIPVRHGMTVGELARLFKGRGWIRAAARLDLRIIPLAGWRRSMMWPQLERPFVPTSPNMPDFETALVYPGLCLLEGTNLSEGRGTPRPFLQFGAPFLDERLRRALGGVPGLELGAVRFTPVAMPGRAARPRWREQECRGIALKVRARQAVRPVAFGLRLIAALRALYPDRFEIQAARLTRLLGRPELVQDLIAGRGVERALEAARGDAEAFRKLRRPYLLYP